MPVNKSQQPSTVFAANLRRFRDEVGLAQAELADRVTELRQPMYQQTVAKIEAGKREVTLDEAHAFARALGRPFTSMFRTPPELLTTAEAKHQRERNLRAIKELAPKALKARFAVDDARSALRLAELEASELEERLIALEELEDVLREIVEPRKGAPRGKRQSKT